MATVSTIEWTEMTWNPVTGCVKISQGCKHCYAERMAKNTPLQGTAADILKQAMINVQAALLQKEPAALMLLTVHDELVIEAPVERTEVVSELLRTTMEQAVTLRVPLKVDVGAAKNWGDC